MEKLGEPVKFFVLILVMAVLPPVCCFASWQVNGNPVCTAIGDQRAPEIVSDGTAGAIIAWHDLRSGYSRIYAQLIDSLGLARWNPDGVPICPGTDDQWNPQLVSDGVGGSIITWYDGRSGSYDIYVQRVDALGAVKWNGDGVAVCTATGFRGRPQICSDGAGGAIIAWHDNRIGHANIYAQRADSLGVVKWLAEGVPVCTTTSDQMFPQLISDGSGGAIIAWQDDRPGYWSVFAQRLDSLGVVKWNMAGVAVCTTTSYQQNPQLAPDGFGGAMMSWEDDRNGYLNIYAQRVDSTGVLMWNKDGVAMRSAAADQRRAQIVSDGAGGATVAWEDSLGNSWDIYAQRVDPEGVLKWTGNGATVSREAGDQQYPQLVPDGSGGAIVAWQDYRSGNYDIYAQSVVASGVGAWTFGGAVVCMAAEGQQYPQLISDGDGGAIVAWEDYRDGNFDVYAKRMAQDYDIGLVFTSASAKVEHGRVTLSWRVTVDVPCSSFQIKRSKTPDGDFVTLDVTVRKEGASLFSCSDYSVLFGNTYWYRIVLAGPLGEEVCGPIEVCVERAPAAYRIYQSYPNPFNPVCTIRYELPTAGKVRLQVLDVRGSLMRRLVDGWREAGVYNEVWDGRADDGCAVPSGVYLYSIKAGEFIATQKTVLLR